MRRAELVMALVMAVFSSYLMFKSAELPIGWIPREGPGGGAFPFWLSAGMFVCSLWIIVRWVKGTGPLSQATEPYMDKTTLKLFLTGAGSLAVMIGAIQFIGVYGAVPLLLIFYMRFLGRHVWSATALLAVLMPVVMFLFFEIGLNITLPKGWTEPLFYPLYDIFL